MSSSRTESSRTGFVLLLAGLSMFGPFSIDTFFPVFPQMEQAFGIGAIEIQQTISVYLFAYALMSLLHGPLSDALGRRSVVLGGVGVFTLASVGCAFSSSLGELLVYRALQGASAGSGIIVGRAIVRDRFHGAEAQRVMSRISMVFGVAPAIAPMIGGLIGSRFGWESTFWFLALFAVILFGSSWRWLSETHPVEARLPLDPLPLFGRYIDMLRDRRFTWLCCSGALNFSALFIYISSAPMFVLTHLRLGATEFGYFFVPVITGMMTGSYLSGWRAGRHSPASNIQLAYLVMLLAGIVNVAYCLLAPRMDWYWALIPIMISGVGITLAFPTLTLLVLDLYPNERGTASSLQSFVQLMTSALVAGVLSPVLAQRPWTLALGAVGATLLGLLSWHKARKAGVSAELAL
ncbi:multidrug effflux MFS transporter [Chitinimonas sp. BJB300]|uniref:multidrug effflux MFS transporter n=1 Tax=Chitinimonas sp. BJB300 TaxID=1559339 RepID=UPI000C119BAC|nr:multidrug effflux MFS transporter [Chitinimonas sp. BJB300]PHV11956.1 Bcr/CflA family drug resistance efflux transporter [Chitinimonas sp. BJB300]TSJ87280.1 multidrug effflux MFS transporter [Chitinimonas sp. BJB300]